MQSDAGSSDPGTHDTAVRDTRDFDAPPSDAFSSDADAIDSSRGDKSPPEDSLADAGSHCFSCEGYFICGGEVNGQIDLMPATDGCYLSGLPGRKLLAADGTITEGGAVVGKAISRGAGVDISHPDGGSWLVCRRPLSCSSP
jgi:hypothetical protein